MSAGAFDLQGHRGARGLAPENTLPAFAAALSLGVSTLELDVAVTRDGVVVVCHDRRLNPDFTRDARGKWISRPGPTVRSLSYAEIQTYDVGRIDPANEYARRWPDQKPIDGTRMPRLADVFALVLRSGNTSVRFNIETKISPLAPEETVDPETFAKALIDVVRASGIAEQRVTMQSFDWRTLQVARRLAPAIETSCLTAQQTWMNNQGDASPWVAGFQMKEHGSVPRMVKAAGCGTWSPFFGEIDKAKVDEAHALGLKVITWTMNEPAQMRQVIDLGVDGLITDRPDIGRQVLKEKNLPLPAPTPVKP
jgi:glycerophosphoryl diester phosphodiesterase